MWQNYLIVMAAHAIVAFSGYLIFGGWKFFRAANVKREVDVDQLAVVANAKVPNGDIPDADRPFQWRHWLTLGGDRLPRRRRGRLRRPRGDGGAARAPWPCCPCRGRPSEAEAVRSHAVECADPDGVRRDGADRPAGADRRHRPVLRLPGEACPLLKSVTGVIALGGGTVSVYSSTSGVVLPAFPPTVPGLVERLEVATCCRLPGL